MNKLKVKIEDDDDWGYKLLVYHNGKLIREEYDSIEPEDATFVRDLSWIKDAIEEAYQLGLMGL